jgi:hypothetical protein
MCGVPVGAAVGARGSYPYHLGLLSSPRSQGHVVMQEPGAPCPAPAPLHASLHPSSSPRLLAVCRPLRWGRSRASACGPTCWRDTCSLGSTPNLIRTSENLLSGLCIPRSHFCTMLWFEYDLPNSCKSLISSLRLMTIRET